MPSERDPKLMYIDDSAAGLEETRKARRKYLIGLAEHLLREEKDLDDGTLFGWSGSRLLLQDLDLLVKWMQAMIGRPCD